MQDMPRVKRAGIPKPSPSWGRWRHDAVSMAGRTVVPAHVTDEDRRVIRSRVTNGKATEDDEYQH